MLGLFKSRNPHREAATRVYGSVVTQARQPAFYTTAGVPDTMEGRFEMIVLHVAAVIDRVRADTTSSDPLATELVAKFVTDIDDSYREIGLSDARVPKKVKKAAAVLYDRTLQYRAIHTDASQDVDRTTNALADAILSNVFPDGQAAEASDDAATTATTDAQRENALRIARYATALRRHLADYDVSALRDGDARFPDPQGLMFSS
ncbi:MAG: ubiquinol-cytochrome C chaperone family protein [Pseudomonadota bacterium]